MEYRRQEDVFEPMPNIQLPSVEQRLHSQAPRASQELSQPFINPYTAPAQQSLSSSELAKRIRTLQRRLHDNMYSRRADEIGPGHGIPGVGHLGDLLTPPGWKESDEPESPSKIQEHFNESRAEARAALARDLEESKALSNEEQEKREASRNEAWATQLKLDKAMMKERLEIHEVYLETKSSLAQYQYMLGHGSASGQMLGAHSGLDRRAGTLVPHQQEPQTLQPPVLFPSRSDSIGATNPYRPGMITGMH